MTKTTRRKSYLTMRDLFWYSENTENDFSNGAIVFLPGRGNTGYSMIRRYTGVLDFTGIGLFSVTPRLTKGWYPPPNGPGDQSDAVSGLPGAVRVVETVLDTLTETYGVARDKTIVVGFSMGAVTAVQFAAHTKSPAAAVICHSGAVLEPHMLPKATHKMPIVLNHAEDDFCFEWFERYIPMKEGLRKKGYRTMYLERETGNHQITMGDVYNLHPLFEKVYGKSLLYDSYSE